VESADPGKFHGEYYAPKFGGANDGYGGVRCFNIYLYISPDDTSKVEEIK